MSSSAAKKYFSLISRAQYFQGIARDGRLRPVPDQNAEIAYHAALTTHVAAWEAYLEELVRIFYSATAKPLLPDFHAIHTIALDRATVLLNKFNTPNFENSRSLLLEYTGYDPYPDWTWPARSMSTLAVKERLNEILQVRHSFAHGYSIPRYSWNISPSGQCRLTRECIKTTELFFKNLVQKTDQGMQRHIKNVYGTSLP